MLWSSLRHERGQDLAEYALVIALIVIAAVLAVTFLGDTVANMLNEAARGLANTP